MRFQRCLKATRLAASAVLVAALVPACWGAESQMEKLYREGLESTFGLNGAKVDETRGFELLEEAAESGSLDAQAFAALALQRGLGTAVDPTKAYETAIVPARRGNPYAQYVLAVCYRTGAGVRPNQKRAETYFKKAFAGFQKLADEGDALAKTELGRFYLTGTPSVEKDWKKAEKYLLEAAEEDLPGAWCGLCSLYERQEKFDEAFEAIGKAAESELPNAIFGVGRAYRKGLGVEPDLEKAKEYFLEAAEKGESQAMVALAQYCLYVEKDAEQAEKWFRKAAQLGDGLAMYELACLQTSAATEINREDGLRAEKMLRCGVAFGDQDSMGAMVDFYLRGMTEEGEQDFDAALELARLAESLDSAMGAYMLGVIYEQGLGVERDLREAKRLFRRGLALAEEGSEVREMIAEKLSRWE